MWRVVRQLYGFYLGSQIARGRKPRDNGLIESQTNAFPRLRRLSSRRGRRCYNYAFTNHCDSPLCLVLWCSAGMDREQMRPTRTNGTWASPATEVTSTCLLLHTRVSNQFETPLTVGDDAPAVVAGDAVKSDAGKLSAAARQLCHVQGANTYSIPVATDEFPIEPWRQPPHDSAACQRLGMGRGTHACKRPTQFCERIDTFVPTSRNATGLAMRAVRIWARSQRPLGLDAPTYDRHWWANVLGVEGPGIPNTGGGDDFGAYRVATHTFWVGTFVRHVRVARAGLGAFVKRRGVAVVERFSGRHIHSECTLREGEGCVEIRDEVCVVRARHFVGHAGAVWLSDGRHSRRGVNEIGHWRRVVGTVAADRGVAVLIDSPRNVVYRVSVVVSIRSASRADRWTFFLRSRQRTAGNMRLTQQFAPEIAPNHRLCSSPSVVALQPTIVLPAVVCETPNGARGARTRAQINSDSDMEGWCLEGRVLVMALMCSIVVVQTPPRRPHAVWGQ